MELYVNTTTTVSHWNDGEEYGQWETNKETTIHSVSLTKPKPKTSDIWSEKFNVLFDTKVGDVVYVLYMTYSSGDSFGFSEGEHETIWLFKDKSLAEAARKEYENCNTYRIDIVVDSGETLKLTNPAWGYFENISSCDVLEFVVEG